MATLQGEIVSYEDAKCAAHCVRATNCGSDGSETQVNRRFDHERSGDRSEQAPKVSRCGARHRCSRETGTSRGNEADGCPSRPSEHRLSSIAPWEIGENARRANHRSRKRPQDNSGKNANQ
jgi:hypothetical protein